MARAASSSVSRFFVFLLSLLKHTSSSLLLLSSFLIPPFPRAVGSCGARVVFDKKTEIGSGGFSHVFRGTLKDGQPCAVKVR